MKVPLFLIIAAVLCLIFSAVVLGYYLAGLRERYLDRKYLNEKLPERVTSEMQDPRSLSHTSLPPAGNNQRVGIGLHRNLSIEELPSNLQELSVRGASQIVNGKSVDIVPVKIPVHDKAQTIRINLRTGEPLQDQEVG